MNTLLTVALCSSLPRLNTGPSQAQINDSRHPLSMSAWLACQRSSRPDVVILLTDDQGTLDAN
jgi:hypothetical protein